jgi:hypothetical protein
MPSVPWKDDEPPVPGHPYQDSLGEAYCEFIRQEARGDIERQNREQETIDAKLRDPPPKSVPPRERIVRSLFGLALFLAGAKFPDDGIQDDEYRLATSAFTLYNLCALVDEQLYPNRAVVTTAQKGVRALLCGISAYLVGKTFELHDFELFLRYASVGCVLASAAFFARRCSDASPERNGLERL